MRGLFALFYLLTLLGFACLAHAQLPLTGAGKGMTGGAVYSGPGDIATGAYFWAGMRAYSTAARGTRAMNLCNPALLNCVDVNSDAVTGKVVVTSATVAGTDCTASPQCLVNILYDQSGNGRNITLPASLSPPVMNVGCTTRAQPCAQFSSAGNYAWQTAVLTLNQSWSLSFWNNNTNTSVRQDFMYADISVSCGTTQTIVAYNVSGTANQIDTFAGSGLFTTVSDSAWHSLGVLFATTGKVSVDGAAPNTGSVGANNITAKNVAIGQECTLSGLNKWNGSVTEIGAWATDISANFSAISSNQTAFY